METKIALSIPPTTTISSLAVHLALVKKIQVLLSSTAFPSQTMPIDVSFAALSTLTGSCCCSATSIIFRTAGSSSRFPSARRSWRNSSIVTTPGTWSVSGEHIVPSSLWTRAAEPRTHGDTRQPKNDGKYRRDCYQPAAQMSARTLPPPKVWTRKTTVS